MIQNYFNNVKVFLGSFISNARLPRLGRESVSAIHGRNACSKKVRASSSNCDQTKLSKILGEFCCPQNQSSFVWSGWPDSNRRSPRPKRGALPTEPHPETVPRTDPPTGGEVAWAGIEPTSAYADSILSAACIPVPPPSQLANYIKQPIGLHPQSRSL